MVLEVSTQKKSMIIVLLIIVLALVFSATTNERSPTGQAMGGSSTPDCQCVGDVGQTCASTNDCPSAETRRDCLRSFCHQDPTMTCDPRHQESWELIRCTWQPKQAPWWNFW